MASWITDDKPSSGSATGLVADAINDGTTTVAPSQNAVFDALATKPTATLDLDATLTANSDTRVGSQKAVKGYVDTASGLLVPKSTVTTKGDLIVATGAGAITRRGVGSNGQVLTADSAQSDGVKWATPAGGFEPRIAQSFSGSTYPVHVMGHAGHIDTNFTTGKIRMLVFPMTVPWNLEELWIQVTSAASSGNNLRVGCWSLTSASVATLLYDSGNILADSLGLKKATSIGLTNLPPGRYAIGVEVQATTGLRHINASQTLINPSTTAVQVVSSNRPVIDVTHTYGSLPASPTLPMSNSDSTYSPASTMIASAA